MIIDATKPTGNPDLAAHLLLVQKEGARLVWVLFSSLQELGRIIQTRLVR